jgi:REP element-mobilizing transposase RayT
MPRPPREESPTGIYHVTSRGIAGEPIFSDGYDYDWFTTLLGRVVERDCWRLYAYCLMTNHFHLLLRAELRSLAAGMQRLKGRYGQLFNDRHGRLGHVFQARYRSVPVKTEAHAVEAMVYIALNPLAAGLVARAEDWSWSSHRSAAGLCDRPPFLADPDELGVFGHEARSATDVYAALVSERKHALVRRGQTLGV